MQKWKSDAKTTDFQGILAHLHEEKSPVLSSFCLIHPDTFSLLYLTVSQKQDSVVVWEI